MSSRRLGTRERTRVTQRLGEAVDANEPGCARDPSHSSFPRREVPANAPASAIGRDTTSGCRGRSFLSGDLRLGPAPCGDFRPILARDLRGMKRSRRSLCQIHLLICRSFTGATGLEPATSGVTGRVGHDDGGRRTPQNSRICRHFSSYRYTLSAWLSQSSHRRLGHEWATGSCLNGQRDRGEERRIAVAVLREEHASTSPLSQG